MSTPVAGTSTGFRGTRAYGVLSSSSPAESGCHANKDVRAYSNSPLPSPIPGPSTGKTRRHLNLSPRRIAFLRKKTQSLSHSTLEEIEENDDDAERLARRSLDENNNSSLNVSSNSSFNLNLSLSCKEVQEHVSKCVKLSAQNRINNQNAFQLKMIDFLVHALKEQNPAIDLNVASTYLDVSKCIYACRVDSVHSDLLKVIGVSRSGKRKHEGGSRDNEEFGDGSGNEHDIPMKRKRKRKNRNIISTVEELRKDVDTYQPQLPNQVGRDALTSDMLMQLCSQGVDQDDCYTSAPICGKVPCSHDERSLKMAVPLVENLIGVNLSHYTKFSFHQEWPLECGLEENNNLRASSSAISLTRDNDGNNFNCQNSVNDEFEDGNMDPGNNDEEANFEAVNQNIMNQNVDIPDFVDEIRNNPNPNSSCEYSYLRQKYIRWSGPAYWKFIVKKRPVENQEEACNFAKKRRKDIDLNFTDGHLKDEIAFKFTQSKISNRLTDKSIMRNWKEEKVSDSAVILNPSCRNLFRFFNKALDTHVLQVDLGNDSHSESVESANTFVEQSDHIGEFSFENSDDVMTLMGNDEPFIDNNLVELPNRVDLVPIAHSLRAKKVCMRELKQVIRMLLSAPQQDESNDSHVKLFSDIYEQLPHHLSRANVISMSPALVFVSLMHVVNEDQISAFPTDDLSDLLVQTLR